MTLDTFDLALLQATIARVLARGGDFAEVFVEDRDGLTLRLEDRRLEQVVGGREQGAGVRLLRGEHTYYAYTDTLDEASLWAAADAVAAALHDAGPGVPVVDLGAVRRDATSHPVVAVALPPDQVDVALKAALVHAADDEARAGGAEVAQVIVGYADARQDVLIVNSLGEAVRDSRTRTRLSVQAVARRDGLIQTGHETVGASRGFEVMDEAAVLDAARAAAGKAIVMLDARPAPMGSMPVVLANGFGGTLFHEACGHGLEADAVAKGASVYAGMMGELVAAPMVSAFDDGSVPNGWGSQAFDDEGVPTRKTQLIADGRLTGYLYDRLRARQLGAAPSGNGRRQTFRHVPIPRMTTTYIAPGAATPEEVIAATPRGFYAKSLAGGQVEPASGSFVFGVAEGYLIENGRVTTPLRGATLVGNGIDVLKNIDMIAGDYEEKSGICGKDGQGVPVGTGQATLRISAMTVGGTG